MSDLNLVTTFSANHVMVIIPCNLVSQMSISGLGRARKAIVCKEVERTINSGFRETR